MINCKQLFETKSPARYILSRYENETGSDPESNGTTDSMKNFPATFIPMRELDESSLEEQC